MKTTTTSTKHNMHDILTIPAYMMNLQLQLRFLDPSYFRNGLD